MDQDQSTPEAGVNESPRQALSIGAGLGAIAKVFHSPSDLGEEIRAGLRWWPALILLIVVGLCVMAAMSPLQMQAIDAQLDTGDLPGGADGDVGDMARTVTVVGSYLSVIIGAPLGLLLVTLFYWLALLITFGEAPYKKLFTLSIYTSFIQLVYQVVNAAYLRLTDPIINSPADLAGVSLNLSPAAFMPDGEGFLFGFLQQLSVFSIWKLVAFIFGASVIMQRGKQAVAWPIVLVFLIGSVLGAWLAILGRSFSGS